MGLWSIVSWLGGQAKSAVTRVSGNLLNKRIGWESVEKQVVRPEVNACPDRALPFRVIEASRACTINRFAFDHLVGADRQQEMLEVMSSMMWQHWRVAESMMRKDRRQRVAFLLFTGPQGTGKTAHARALADYFGIPCVVLNPGSAKFVSADGLSMVRQVMDYVLQRGSAVLLLDEIDTYADDEGFMSEVRQVVDGAAQIHEEAILYIIGTTNKEMNTFPRDLLHRVLLRVPFGE
eukprot:5756998-Amphidinium_carterae.1